MDIEDVRANAVVYVLDKLYSDLAFPYFHVGDAVVICDKLTIDQVEDCFSLLLEMKDILYAPYGYGGSYMLNR